MLAPTAAARPETTRVVPCTPWFSPGMRKGTIPCKRSPGAGMPVFSTTKPKQRMMNHTMPLMMFSYRRTRLGRASYRSATATHQARATSPICQLSTSTPELLATATSMALARAYWANCQMIDEAMPPKAQP